MDPIANRLRLVLLTAVAFVCVVALTGVIVTKPRGVLDGAAPAGIMQQWPRKYLDGTVLTGVVLTGGVPR